MVRSSRLLLSLPLALALPLTSASCDAAGDYDLSPTIWGGSPETTHRAVGKLRNSKVDSSGVVEAYSSCTATLVDPDLLVTAAHCVDGNSGPMEFQPNHTVGSSTPAIPVAYFVPSPNWTETTRDALEDWAFVRLAFPVSGITPIALAEAHPDAFEALAVGYGYRSDTLDPEGRRATTVSAQNHTSGQVRAVARGSGICHGDSGGPLIYTGSDGPRIAGVLSGWLSPIAESPTIHCAAEGETMTWAPGRLLASLRATAATTLASRVKGDLVGSATVNVSAGSTFTRIIPFDSPTQEVIIELLFVGSGIELAVGLDRTPSRLGSSFSGADCVAETTGDNKYSCRVRTGTARRAVLAVYNGGSSTQGIHMRAHTRRGTAPTTSPPPGTTPPGSTPRPPESNRPLPSRPETPPPAPPRRNPRPEIEDAGRDNSGGCSSSGSDVSLVALACLGAVLVALKTRRRRRGDNAPR